MTRALALLLFATVTAVTATAAAQDPPPATTGAETGTPSATAPRDLRSIARREAAREEAALTTRVKALIQDLRSSSDTGIGLIRGKIDELAAIGMPALDQLLATMNHTGANSSAMNAGVNSSRALALIPGQPVDDALKKLAVEGTSHGRRNAARALGLRGDPNALPVLVALLEAEDAALCREAIRALGNLGHADASKPLMTHVDAEDLATASVAIESLGKLPGDAASGTVLARLGAEAGKDGGNEAVLEAALGYLTTHPTPDGLDLARELLASNAAAMRVRQAAVDALVAIAIAYPPTKKSVLAALEDATRLGLRTVVRAAARAMLTLGDDSGVDAVTADYDFDIQRNPKNFNARYKRADVFLEFKRWKSAYQDLQYGLKIEKEPRDPERIYLALARASAGLRRFGESAKYLRRLTAGDFSGFPTEYPEFSEMASDSRYAALFDPSK